MKTFLYILSAICLLGCVSCSGSDINNKDSQGVVQRTNMLKEANQKGDQNRVLKQGEGESP